MNPLRAIALLAVLPGLACGLWAPDPEPLPTLQLPPAEYEKPAWAESEPDLLGTFGTAGLWLAKSPIGSFYLFGASEIAPEGGYAVFGLNIAAAYAESQEVVHEIDLNGIEPARTIALLRRYGALKSPATLKSRLSNDTWTLLEQKFAESGRSAAAVRAMQPWLVSYAIANSAPLARGADPLAGIAEQVQMRAQRAKGDGEKPLIGLRSLESQFQMLSALPDGVQESLLRNALGGSSTDEFLSGNPALLPVLAASSKERELYYELLVYRRNEQMAERLFEIGIDGKLRFVAVGILHLVGERGIPALLGQRGYRVSRVQ